MRISINTKTSEGVIQLAQFLDLAKQCKTMRGSGGIWTASVAPHSGIGMTQGLAIAACVMEMVNSGAASKTLGAKIKIGGKRGL